MNRSVRAMDTVLFAAWLTTVASASQPPAVSFDEHGRVTLAGVAATPTEASDDPIPPTGPPNLQCPC